MPVCFICFLMLDFVLLSSFHFILFPCRLLPLYFPRDKQEEEMALSKLPADVGDENGETVINERKIRIKPLPKPRRKIPKPPKEPVDLPVSDVGLVRRSVNFNLVRDLIFTYFIFHSRLLVSPTMYDYLNGGTNLSLNKLWISWDLII